MAIRRTRMFFLIIILVLLFYFLKSEQSTVFARDWKTCDYKCAQEIKNDRICYVDNIICKCLDGGKRVTDGLGNTTKEWWYVEITKCEGSCKVDYDNGGAICLDKDGQVQDIRKIENEIEQMVSTDPLPIIDTGNLGSPDGQVPNQPGGKDKYNYCATSTGGKGVDSALGCIPIDMTAFGSWFMQIIFGIAGGVAFLLMVYGFVLMAVSGGDEKKVQGAKETVTSAITGLLISIFALFIFRLIAVNILQIPGIN